MSTLVMPDSLIVNSSDLRQMRAGNNSSVPYFGPKPDRNEEEQKLTPGSNSSWKSTERKAGRDGPNALHLEGARSSSNLLNSSQERLTFSNFIDSKAMINRSNSQHFQPMVKKSLPKFGLSIVQKKISKMPNKNFPTDFFNKAGGSVASVFNSAAKKRYRYN